jgi:hypothetical protein
MIKAARSALLKITKVNQRISLEMSGEKVADNVTTFKQYSFQQGQKIRIEDGRRKGDWQVVDVTEKKVTLRCPVSNVEVQWARFCYFAQELENEQWPLDD